MENGGKAIVDEGMRTKCLQKKSMKELNDLMFQFLVEKFTLNAADTVLKQICLACINVIPCLKTPNSTIGGIVSIFYENHTVVWTYTLFRSKYVCQEHFYNYNNRPITGIFFNKVKNAKQSAKKATMTALEINHAEEDLIRYFKECTLNGDNLKEKLHETIELRKELIKKSTTKFHENFPFYFADTSFVSITNIFVQDKE